MIAETEVGVNEYKVVGVAPSRIALVPPPFDLDPFLTLPPKGQFRRKYRLENKKVVLFLGRIHLIKGIDHLVKGFARFAATEHDAVLVIVGNDDGYKTTLEKLITSLGIGNKVLFAGFLGGVDKLSALVDADVLVQTSRYEQGAWAPFEAVLCHTPIIVSGNSGAGEDVQRIDAGYLVELGNPQDLAERIQYVIDHKAEAVAKTEKARTCIMQTRSMASCIQEYEKIYQEVIRERKL